MAAELKEASIAVVLIGEFSPTVFQPAWFEKNNLIAASESNAAKVEVIHQQITKFEANWLSLVVAPDRFTASCSRDDANLLLRDFVVGVFQLLSEQPVSALGLNRHYHFKMASEQEWHDVGHKLAPKAPWDGLLVRPGLRSLTMQGQRTDGDVGTYNVIVQPSAKFPNSGVFVQVNDHRSVTEDDQPVAASKVALRLSQIWETSLENSEKIAKSIVKL